MQMAASSKKGVQPERLPPTEDAIKYHAVRVHLQTLQWVGTQVEATQWGWRNENSVLVPITTDKVRRCDKLILCYLLVFLETRGTISEDILINNANFIFSSKSRNH